MKKDPIEALTEIRVLCNHRLEEPPAANKDPNGPFSSVSYDKNRNLFIRIEWICRHALEDGYDFNE